MLFDFGVVVVLGGEEEGGWWPWEEGERERSRDREYLCRAVSTTCEYADSL